MNCTKDDDDDGKDDDDDGKDDGELTMMTVR